MNVVHSTLSIGTSSQYVGAISDFKRHDRHGVEETAI